MDARRERERGREGGRERKQKRLRRAIERNQKHDIHVYIIKLTVVKVLTLASSSVEAMRVFQTSKCVPSIWTLNNKTLIMLYNNATFIASLLRTLIKL